MDLYNEDRSLKLQDYTKEPLIKGVKISTPQVHRDCGGEFRELYRFQGESYDSNGLVNWGDYGNWVSSEIQINHSILEPGVIKAFHYHKNQSDEFYLIDKGIVVLHDLREDSETYKITNRLVLQNQRVFVPRGVLHGIGNPYLNKLHMIYFTDQFFNPKDEFRLSWDYLGSEIFEVQKG